MRISLRNALVWGTATVLLILGLGLAADGPAGIGGALELIALIAASVFAVFGLLIATVFIAVLIHELGHVAAAKLVGFRLVFMQVGPIRAEWTTRRCRLVYQKHSRRLMGLTGALPESPEHLGARHAGMILGGIVASLALFALVAAGAFWPGRAPALQAFVPHADLPSTLVSCATMLVLYVSFMMALSAVWPSRPAGFMSDGLVLWHALRKTREFDRVIALLQINVLQTAGVRPRDWDDRLVDAAISLQDCSVAEALALSALSQRLTDLGDLQGAADAADKALEVHRASGGGHPQLGLVLRCAGAFLHARLGHAERARALYDEANGERYGFEPVRLRALAAMLLAEGDRPGARDAAEKAYAELDACPSDLRGNVQAFHEWTEQAFSEATRADPEFPDGSSL